MKQSFVLFLTIQLLFVGISLLKAQEKIALHHNGEVSFYITTKLDSAILAAQAGDTIYLPGYVFEINGSIVIDKPLHLVGAGYHPDSTLATGATYFLGGVSIHPGAGGGSISGIYIEGSIYFGINNTNNNIRGYRISDCRIFSIEFASYNTSTGIVIRRNVIVRNILGGDVQKCVVTNNLIGNIVKDFGNNCLFQNNIFFYSGVNGKTLQGMVNCLFENNIFLYNYRNAPPFSTNVSNFRNNIFLTSFSFPSDNNIGTGNIFDQAQSSIFVNQSGHGFNFTHNYHLQASSSGANGGTDGTDIGIYGGPHAFKENWAPWNPRIISKFIDAKTDSSGHLKIKIKVKAQNN